MKKIGIVLVVIIIIALIIVGVVLFNKQPEQTSSTEESSIQGTSTSTNNSSEDVFTFKSGETTIPLGVEYSSLNLGEAKDYYEVQSCAFDGMDKIYTFDHYEVHTYPDAGTDKVLSVYFLDDQVTTTEGVKIGDSIDTMTEKYGSEYEQLDTQYTYSKGQTQLKFIVENNLITSIEYNFNV